ncbi:MAG: hypothetical protein IBX61_09325 [Thermoleophilia bacterium]|nr:hypothetical protein [Thermoleophilia bacterium]
MSKQMPTQPVQKTCRFCRSIIDRKATRCPHCASDLRTWPARHPVITALLIIFVGLPFFGGIISALNSGSSPDSETPDKKQTTTPYQQTRTEPKVSSEEKAYRDGVMKISNDVSESLGELGGFVSENPLPFLWTDEEVIKLAMHTVIIEGGYDEAQKLNPPEKFKDVHASFIMALDKFAQSMRIFREGVDNLDVEKLEQATALMNEGSAYMNEATAKMAAVS